MLRFAADAQVRDLGLPALLPFSGGNVTIEGLAFELDREGPNDRVAAISVEDTVLTIRGCLFRQSAVRTGRNRAALRIRVRKTMSAGGDRPPAVFADTCHFDGGQVGIVAEGPADILLRDCTLGPCSPTIWLDNSKSTSPVPAEIHLRHSSLMTGTGPVFEIEGALARIALDDCVIAPAGNSLPTLVAIDSTRNLTWRGRHNLYGRVRTYLEPMQKGEASEPIESFGQWKDTTGEVREVDTLPADTAVWSSPEPLQDLIIQQENPTQAFQLATRFLKVAFFGARQGPYNARLVEPARLAGRLGETGSATLESGADRPSDPNGSLADLAARAAPIPSNANSSTLAADNVGSVGEVSKPMPADAVDDDEDTASLPTMQPMSIPPPDTARSPANAAGLEPGAANLPARTTRAFARQPSP